MAVDLDATIRFWQECFGAEVVADEPMAGSRNVFLDVGGGRLNLYDQPPNQRGPVNHLGVQVADLDATVDKLEAAGWKPRPKKSDGPLSYVMVEGPDGLLLEVFHFEDASTPAELRPYFDLDPDLETDPKPAHDPDPNLEDDPMADQTAPGSTFVAVVKQDCQTCVAVAPVLVDLANRTTLTIYSQDEPGFPDGVDVVDDTNLDFSWHHDIETVPTLIRLTDGEEIERVVGWDRRRWTEFLGLDDLVDVPSDFLPGCGSLSVDPTLVDDLAVRFGGRALRTRRVELATLEDEIEAMYDRGWSDGLPLVPPTEARVLRMLEGTTRDPSDIVAVVPPALAEATVEQVAINAVMAGCKPEYLPVVLAAVEGACTDRFNMHGLLCTLYFSGPIVIVNGPIRNRIGMNSGKNALGQGNRANSTIGRALQLVVRNIGGGRPGVNGIDRSALGAPSKVGWCFAEDEEHLPDGWPALSVERGLDPGQDAVTLFAGHGPIAAVDQLSRTPESLTRSLAAQLMAVGHPKIPNEAMLILTPEHQRVFADAGWSKERFREELDPLLMLDGDTAQRGVGGIEVGLPRSMAGRKVPKFRRGSLMIARVGGNAGAFSAILAGWFGGPKGSEPITVPIEP
jgi:catechol 2,3-dioxygenase-like lactoylglutathione lyase family enzyme